MATTDTITIHSPGLCAQLLNTGPEQRAELPVEKTAKEVLPADKRVQQSNSSYLDVAKIDQWLSAKAARGVHEFPPDLELASALELCNAISSEEMSFQQELDDFLEAEKTFNHRKKEMLYQNWLKNVFNPMHSKLSEVMKGSMFKEYDNKKRALFEKYLQYRNKKGYVFLDTMDVNEYDALQLSSPSSTLKAQLKPMDDPLTSQLKDQCMEQRVITSCDHGATPGVHIDRPESPRQLCRQDTDCGLWLAMEIVQIESTLRKRSRHRMNPSYNEAAMDDENWHNSKATPEMILKELGMPHKKPIHYDRKKINLQWSEHSS